MRKRYRKYIKIYYNQEFWITAKYFYRFRNYMYINRFAFCGLGIDRKTFDNILKDLISNEAVRIYCHSEHVRKQLVKACEKFIKQYVEDFKEPYGYRDICEDSYHITFQYINTNGEERIFKTDKEISNRLRMCGNMILSMKYN